MSVPAVPLLFAADPGMIVGLIVGALTLLGWILNYANQKQAQQPPINRPNRPARPQRAGDDRLQSEIDVFLEEVRGGRRKLADEPGRQRPVAEAPRQGQRPPQQARRPIRPAAQQPLQPNVTSRVEPQIAGRKQDRSRIRSRVSEPVSSDRIEAHAVQLGRGVEASVESHLGRFAGGEGPAASATTGAAAADSGSLAQQVRRMLSEPEGVRQAVLISEILSRHRPSRRP
ncbi:MAG TPA: hypothetical protein VML55_11620 [Planctomycetaceae bacterium]|nr:hypothetical protein [Planctomycetaceae bacterium]